MRPKKITVFAYGEGEDERIFLRHLVASYCRSNIVSVQTSSAGGGDPVSILNKALRVRGTERRDIEFVLLDTIPPWPHEMTAKALADGIKLVGSDSCLESFFLQILEPGVAQSATGAHALKETFQKKYCLEGRFNEKNCASIFTKQILNEARTRVPNLNYLIKTMEGEAGLFRKEK